MSVFLWVLVALAVVVVVADVLYRQYASRRIRGIIENVPTFAAVPTPPEPEHEVFTIQTVDGIDLQACLYEPDGAPRGVIVFCPELNGNHWTALNYAPALVKAGFVLLSFDFRNQGASGRKAGYEPIHWVTEFELTDLDAVLAYASESERLRDLPLGIVGISRGGSAALIAACRHSRIRAVATDSGYSTMSLIRNFMDRFSRFVVPDWIFSRLPRWHIGLVLRQALERSERRRDCRYIHLEKESARLPAGTATLLISGNRDSYVTPNVTRELARVLGREHSVSIFAKARHNKSRMRSPEDYDRMLVEHFEQALPAGERDTESVPFREPAAHVA